MEQKVKQPFQLPKSGARLDTLYSALKDSLKEPRIGVTQGGSSRRDRGARVAATTAEVKQLTAHKENSHG